jgi:hypothetical protein
MLRQIRELGTYRLHATDGDIGHLEQFYFDDRDWKIRYFVVDIGTWLHGKKVLMLPSSIVGVDATTKTINAGFTKQQVQESEDVAKHQPQGLEQGHDYSLYLGLPHYLGLSDSELGPVPHVPKRDKTSEQSLAYDEHLRSSKVVSRYHVMAVDGEIGHIEDGIVDDQTWTIQYLVSTVRNRWSSKKVLLPTEWLLWINTAESNVYVSLTRNSIAAAPAYDPAKPLTHDFEIALHDHYWRFLPKLDSGRRSNEPLSSVVSLLETLEGRNYRAHKRRY